jgi:hypothetical protein
MCRRYGRGAGALVGQTPTYLLSLERATQRPVPGFSALYPSSLPLSVPNCVPSVDCARFNARVGGRQKERKQLRRRHQSRRYRQLAGPLFSLSWAQGGRSPCCEATRVSIEQFSYPGMTTLCQLDPWELLDCRTRQSPTPAIAFGCAIQSP